MPPRACHTPRKTATLRIAIDNRAGADDLGHSRAALLRFAPHLNDGVGGRAGVAHRHDAVCQQQRAEGLGADAHVHVRVEEAGREVQTLARNDLRAFRDFGLGGVIDVFDALAGNVHALMWNRAAVLDVDDRDIIDDHHV